MALDGQAASMENRSGKDSSPSESANRAGGHRPYYYRVTSGGWVYPQSAEAAQVFFTTLAGRPGDFDLDQDVDQADFGHLQACLTGSPGSPAQGCSDADLNQDNRIDELDLGVFRGCMSGPNQPPGC